MSPGHLLALLLTQAPDPASAPGPVPEAAPTTVPEASSPVPEASSPVPEASPPVPEATPEATPTPVPEASPPVPADSPPDPRQARRTRFAEAAAFDIVGTGARRRGAWAAGVQLGYPWFGLRAQVGVVPRLALLFEVETAMARRWRPALGLSLRWVDRKHVRLGGEVLLGWLVQGEPLDRRGPSGELRMRLAIPIGRVAPYLSVGTQHAVLPDRTRIVGVGGTDTQWSARHEWTPKASLGVAITFTRRIGIDLGIDLAWVDAPRTIALPGLHFGLLFGAGPRGGPR